jgi:hypothetical protein
MAFPFQDVEYFRGGLKRLFVAPLLGFSTTLAAFANISATFIRILLWPLAVREMLVPSDVILEPAARSWKRGRLASLLTPRQLRISIML